ARRAGYALLVNIGSRSGEESRTQRTAKTTRTTGTSKEADFLSLESFGSLLEHALAGSGVAHGNSAFATFLLVSRALGTVQPGPADPDDRQRDERGPAVDRVGRAEEPLSLLRAGPAPRGPDGGGPAAPDAQTGAVAVAGPHRGALYPARAQRRRP